MRVSLAGLCLALAGSLVSSTTASKEEASANAFGPVIEVASGNLKRRSFKSYFLDAAPVTNEAFRKFARSTKFKTDAERFGWSFVLRDVIPERVLSSLNETLPNAPWWVSQQAWLQDTL
jgi:formylglycine-generating enzyme required for sulfatase activity